MEIYADLSKLESLDELQATIVKSETINKALVKLRKTYFECDENHARLFLSSYVFVLYPESCFKKMEDILLANAAAELIQKPNKENLNKFNLLFHEWKKEDLVDLIESIEGNIVNIPENDADQRFQDGFELQNSILKLALTYFNFLKNKITHEQQNNPASNE